MNTAFKMINVGAKLVSHRRAVARGEIQLCTEICRKIEEKRIPKGDVLVLAEIAGICAAKKTSDLLPLCHPLNLDAVQIRCELDSINSRVLVSCEVSATAKTGVEMEALSGVSAALLCIYDLTKGLDKAGVISGIFLEEKEGGKSGIWRHPSLSAKTEQAGGALQGMRAAALTVSDSCAAHPAQDQSGQLLSSFLNEQGAQVCTPSIVPDELDLIREKIKRLALEEKVGLLLVSGGTGIGPRDITPEALRPLWSKSFPGFGELFRSTGLMSTPRAWLSRAEAGLVGDSLVVSLPGSPAGVAHGLAILGRELPHMLAMLRGEKH